jgi:hypothetical protein
MTGGAWNRAAKGTVAGGTEVARIRQRIAELPWQKEK